MKTAIKYALVLALLVDLSALSSTALSADAKPAVPPNCSGGVWTPTPVQHVDNADATNPTFHTVYGLSCSGHVLMVRFSNVVNGTTIVVDVLSRVAVACNGGTWTPSAIQHAEGGPISDLTFHAVWGLACGANVYMVRFGNKVGGNRIVVDILGQAVAQ